MAWTRDGSPALPISTSPSLAFNNLSCADSGVVYVSKGRAALCGLDGHEIGLLNQHDGARVYQACLCTLGGTDLLVVALDTGVQVWTADCKRMLYFFDLQGVASGGPEGDLLYTQGIAAVPGRSHFLVGCSDGCAFVFSVRTAAEDSKIELSMTLEGQCQPARPVTCCAASSEFAASADTAGNIVVYNVEDSYAQECSLRGKGPPVTSMCVSKGIVAASYSTGHLRIFSVLTRELSVEVAAHSRTINAIALQPFGNSMVVASVGEDCFLNVWELPDFSAPGRGQVGLLASSTIPNQLLTGVAFVPDGTGQILATACDCNSIFMWKKL